MMVSAKVKIMKSEDFELGNIARIEFENGSKLYLSNKGVYIDMREVPRGKETTVLTTWDELELTCKIARDLKYV